MQFCALKMIIGWFSNYVCARYDLIKRAVKKTKISCNRLILVEKAGNTTKFHQLF